MKRPTFLRGVVVAAALAALAAAAIAVIAPLLGFGLVVRALIPLLAMLYLLQLLANSPVRIGRVSVFVAWGTLAIATWWLALPLPVYLIVHGAALWLVRSLYFYAGVLPALLDLGLCAASLVVAGWAWLQSGSVFLATWTLLLVQALFVAIPPAIGRAEPPPDGSWSDRFERARRQADAALSVMMNR